MSPWFLGVLLGLVAGLGWVLAVWRLPLLHRPSLDDRLSPYLRDSSRPSRLLLSQRALTPFPTLERICAPVLRDAVRFLERILGGSTSVRRRLEMAGRAMTVEQFRAEQIVWGSGALLGAVTVSLLVVVDTPRRALPAAAFCCMAAVVGVLARDQWLTREVRRREHRMMAEFPTIAELLALVVRL